MNTLSINEPRGAAGIDELLALDLLTLREHTERAGGTLDPAGLRASIEASLKVSELCTLHRDGRLAAYALLHRESAEGWFVSAFNTHPDHRSAPALSAFFRAFLERVHALGIGTLRSNVYKTNRLSMAFHQRLGFRVTRENAEGVEFFAAVSDIIASPSTRRVLERSTRPRDKAIAAAFTRGSAAGLGCQATEGKAPS